MIQKEIRMRPNERPLFLGGQCRIMCRASNDAPTTRSSVPHGDTESLADKVAVTAAFLLCVVLLMFMG